MPRSSPQAAFVPMLALLPKDVATIVLPLAVMVAVAAASAQIPQFWPLFKVGPLTPNLSCLYMATGFKRPFALRSHVDLIKTTIKIGAVVLMTGHTIPRLLGDLVDLARVRLRSGR